MPTCLNLSYSCVIVKKKPKPAHKHLILSRSFFLVQSITQETLPVNRSKATLVEVHALQLYDSCLDLFSVGLSSMTPCQPVS